MKFEILRDLTNKVFTTTIKRKFIQDDPDDINEAELENDFGSIQLEAGKVFEGSISKNLDETFSAILDKSPGIGKIAFKFSVPSNIVTITKNSSISYKCDGKLEADIVFEEGTTIPALKVAELKCELFEKAIEQKIKDAVKLWKEQKTDFEKKTPVDIFTVDL